MVAGGGFHGGHVVGASDARAEQVKTRPVYPGDLIGTMYELVGIDPVSTSLIGNVEVDADRANNRIVVKARGVEQFVLFLNDDLVDLDKEFTVVVNDKAFVEKKVRSFRDMVERMVVRRDWDYLFPVMYATTVPKATAEEKPAAEKK